MPEKIASLVSEGRSFGFVQLGGLAAQNPIDPWSDARPLPAVAHTIRDPISSTASIAGQKFRVVAGPTRTRAVARHFRSISVSLVLNAVVDGVS